MVSLLSGRGIKSRGFWTVRFCVEKGLNMVIDFDKIVLEALMEAKECIEDAIYSEDGCDGAKGEDALALILDAIRWLET